MTGAQGLLPFQVELVDHAESVTAYAAVPLVVEALRAVIATARYRQLRADVGLSVMRGFQASGPSQAKARRRLEDTAVPLPSARRRTAPARGR